jgi:hypothetical protein
MSLKRQLETRSGSEDESDLRAHVRFRKKGSTALREDIDTMGSESAIHVEWIDPEDDTNSSVNDAKEEETVRNVRFHDHRPSR